MTQSKPEFRLDKAELPPYAISTLTQAGTEVRRITVSGYRSVTIIYFQKFEGRWVPFKRRTISVN
jgi:hypothetical protein